MKLKQIIEATEPLKRLSEKRLASYKKMRELVKLRKAVEQELELELEDGSLYLLDGEWGPCVYLPELFFAENL